MRRTPLIAIGVVLVLLGAAILIWKGVSYTQRETLVDVGSVTVTADTRKSVPLSPILGGVALAGGAVLIVVGYRKS
jgi:uncharacterized membrane protein